MSPDRRGVAVIGAGDMGARHARHWAATGARIVVVCDPDAARASVLAAEHGAVSAADPIEAVALPGVDVVSVCTPTYLHPPVTIAALEGGRDVLCEKPVALTLADAEAMAAAERSSGRRLRIGFTRRFDPVWRHVESDIDELGGPIMAQATLAAGVRPKLLMHDARANGGPVIDMACHLFDRWERVFGVPPVRVAAHGHTFGADKPELAGIEHVALDTVQVSLDYGEAGSGQIQLSWGLPSGIPAMERHTYVGPGGLIETDGTTVQLVRGAEPRVYERDGVDPWAEQIRAFARELDGDGPQGLADVHAGTRALRASLAVLAAVRDARPVDPSRLSVEAMPT
ncbi:MAG: Gfo/Idh/MocA family oxidoreductase [Trueperaceae bacterium]|nr:Gfo/Idh/MocA family oxidoreductase [Trueperaceae bacterium]